MIFDIPVRLSGKMPTPAFRRRRFVIRAKTFGVECPVCRCPTSTAVDSRNSPTGRRRRRECVECHHRFTTLEAIVGYKNV